MLTAAGQHVHASERLLITVLRLLLVSLRQRLPFLPLLSVAVSDTITIHSFTNRLGAPTARYLNLHSCWFDFTPVTTHFEVSALSNPFLRYSKVNSTTEVNTILRKETVKHNMTAKHLTAKHNMTMVPALFWFLKCTWQSRLSLWRRTPTNNFCSHMNILWIPVAAIVS